MHNSDDIHYSRHSFFLIQICLHVCIHVKDNYSDGYCFCQGKSYIFAKYRSIIKAIVGGGVEECDNVTEMVRYGHLKKENQLHIPVMQVWLIMPHQLWSGIK